MSRKYPGLTKTGSGNANGFVCMDCNAGYDSEPPGGRCYQPSEKHGRCDGSVVPYDTWAIRKFPQ